MSAWQWWLLWTIIVKRVFMINAKNAAIYCESPPQDRCIILIFLDSGLYFPRPSKPTPINAAPSIMFYNNIKKGSQSVHVSLAQLYTDRASSVCGHNIIVGAWSGVRFTFTK